MWHSCLFNTMKLTILIHQILMNVPKILTAVLMCVLTQREATNVNVQLDTHWEVMELHVMVSMSVLACRAVVGGCELWSCLTLTQ